MRAAAILLLLACSLLVACDRGAKSASESTATSPAATPAPTPAGAATAADHNAPDFELEPLAQSDVDLYLGIMREAVEKFRHLPAAGQATLKEEDDYYRKLRSGWHPSPTDKEADLFKRAIALHHLDYDIARQKGVFERYSALAAAIEGMVGPEKCGDSDCGQGMPEDTPATRKQQLEDDKKRRLIVKQDLALLQPNAAEILALATELRLMPNERARRRKRPTSGSRHRRLRLPGPRFFVFDFPD